MNIDTTTLMKFALRALIWGLTYYFIRHGLNPEVTDLEKVRGEAIYGSLANFVGAVLFLLVDQYLA